MTSGVTSADRRSSVGSANLEQLSVHEIVDDEPKTPIKSSEFKISGGHRFSSLSKQIE